MYHFFVERSQVREDSVIIEGNDVNHIKNVLRMKPGEKISVSDGGNRKYLCEITELGAREVVAARLSEEESFAELDASIYLFQGLPKSDKMEFIIQKAVELGAAAIVPMATGRAVVKLDAKKEENKRKRWSAIAQSSAKQSGRTIIPQILPVMELKEAVQYLEGFDYKFIPYELADNMEETRELIKNVKPQSRIGILIGPEGGFDRAEVEYAVEHGIVPITLGKRILRTETAGMALLSVLMFWLEA